jgi:CRISPR system Cascade subunit CasE
MYLSLLKLNPRSRRAMTEISRPYELHRSIMMAFPNNRGNGLGRVLFRLDVDGKSGDIAVLVQSRDKPDWTALNSTGGFLLEQPRCKSFEPPIVSGTVLYFRLRANPSVKRNGKRLGTIKEEEQVTWLRRKAKESGFEVLSLTVIAEGMARDGMTDPAGARHNLSLLSVRFEGILRVTDPKTFREALEKGIGSAKGLGFGLLSIAPLRS